MPAPNLRRKGEAIYRRWGCRASRCCIMGLAILQLQGIELKGGLIPEVWHCLWELIHGLTADFMFNHLLFRSLQIKLFWKAENTIQERVFQAHIRSEQMSCWCWKGTHCCSLLPGSSGCWDWNPGCPSSSSPPPSPSLSRQRRGRRVRSSMGLHPPPWTSSWEAHSWCSCGQSAEKGKEVGD